MNAIIYVICFVLDKSKKYFLSFNKNKEKTIDKELLSYGI
jgi:hypothetical protein